MEYNEENKSNNKKKIRHKVLLPIHRVTRANGSEYFLDLTRAYVSRNIPSSKLDDSKSRSFLENHYTNKQTLIVLRYGKITLVLATMKLAKNLATSIVRLETSGLSLIESVNIVNEIKDEIQKAPDEIGKIVYQKLTTLLNKNEEFKIVIQFIRYFKRTRRCTK